MDPVAHGHPRAAHGRRWRDDRRPRVSRGDARARSGGVKASDIDLIVLGTTTPDIIFPSTACLLQHRLGANGCAAFDVNAACSGFVYALGVADAFIRCGQAKKALVVGAETLTRMLDWSDRGTCVLFGDGSGAVVLEASDDPASSRPSCMRRWLQAPSVQPGRLRPAFATTSRITAFAS